MLFILGTLLIQVKPAFACGTSEEKVLDFFSSTSSGGTYLQVVLVDSNNTTYAFKNPPNDSSLLEDIVECAYGGSHIRVRYWEDCQTGRLTISTWSCTTDPID